MFRHEFRAAGLIFDAEFKAKGFILRAPKIRVQDTPARVKVTVLEKVKAGN